MTLCIQAKKIHNKKYTQDTIILGEQAHNNEDLLGFD